MTPLTHPADAPGLWWWPTSGTAGGAAREQRRNEVPLGPEQDIIGFLARVIVLNGASSSGKSSIATQLVERLPGRVRAVSYDRPQTMVASSPIAGARLAATLARAVALDPRTALGFAGPAAAFSAARALADDGITTVVDVVVTRPETAVMMTKLLGPAGFVVGVRCSIEELLRREEARPTRRGLAVRQVDHVHAHVTYDIEVHTDVESSEGCATRIIAALLSQN